ncbi:MAG: shikimate kinase [Deltaproteobacteria bacterium]|nr:shikimate kinase [Deltaproteobacteria bacterium]
MNIVLMGYRCTGKTSTAKALANLLERPFVDTDALIEERQGRPIPEIVAEKGWPGFRIAETAVILDLAAADGLIIALGGGAVLELANVAALKKNGFFVWLTADPETICARMGKDEATGTTRPSLTGKTSREEIAAVLAVRTPLYQRLAELTIDTTALGPEAVAEQVRAALPTGAPLARIKPHE